jgi:hypothetical protein
MTRMSYRGLFTFEDAAAVREALDATADLLAALPAPFRRAFSPGFLRPSGTRVEVAVQLEGPEAWDELVASLIDELAEDAVAGGVDARVGDATFRIEVGTED